jgi:hypothetical protein
MIWREIVSDTSLFNATTHGGIVKGHCVMIDDDGEGDICYGGPIKEAPRTGGKLVLLHSEDFERLKLAVERKRH